LLSCIFGDGASALGMATTRSVVILVTTSSGQNQKSLLKYVTLLGRGSRGAWISTNATGDLNDVMSVAVANVTVAASEGRLSLLTHDSVFVAEISSPRWKRIPLNLTTTVNALPIGIFSASSGEQVIQVVPISPSERVVEISTCTQRRCLLSRHAELDGPMAGGSGLACSSGEMSLSSYGDVFSRTPQSGWVPFPYNFDGSVVYSISSVACAGGDLLLLNSSANDSHVCGTVIVAGSHSPLSATWCEPSIFSIPWLAATEQDIFMAARISVVRVDPATGNNFLIGQLNVSVMGYYRPFAISPIPKLMTSTISMLPPRSLAFA
jgi:hypothetical protein